MNSVKALRMSQLGLLSVTCIQNMRAKREPHKGWKLLSEVQIPVARQCLPLAGCHKCRDTAESHTRTHTHACTKGVCYINVLRRSEELFAPRLPVKPSWQKRDWCHVAVEPPQLQEHSGTATHRANVRSGCNTDRQPHNHPIVPPSSSSLAPSFKPTN